MSGPLLDRIDLAAHLGRPTRRELSGPPTIDSGRAREQIVCARERQAARLLEEGIGVNAQMDARMLRRHLQLDDGGERLLRVAQDRQILSARGLHRLLRVARTAADLEGSRRTCERHVSAALALRTEAGIARRRTA